MGLIRLVFFGSVRKHAINQKGYLVIADSCEISYLSHRTRIVYGT